MKLSLVSLVSSALVVVAALAPSLALADTTTDPKPVTCVAGAFGDRVEQGRVAGDGAAVFAARKAVYWVDVANPGAPTQVTLVWSLDGREVQRQSLDVGSSSHWHTWGIRPLGGAKKIDVEVLDAAGHSLRTDTLAATAS